MCKLKILKMDRIIHGTERKLILHFLSSLFLLSVFFSIQRPNKLIDPHHLSFLVISLLLVDELNEVGI